MDARVSLEEFFRLTTPQKQALKKLGLVTVRDLLFHFPERYGTLSQRKHIALLQKGDVVSLYGRISKLEKTRAFRKKIPMTKAVLEDASGKIRIVWFHQPYIAHMIRDGSLVELSGKIGEDTHGLYIANPTSGDAPSPTQNILDTGEKKDNGSLIPVYPESRGITSRWFYYALKKILLAGTYKKIEDPLAREILKTYNLPSLHTALVWIHQPKKIQDAEAARKRFAFEEVFFIQLERLRSRAAYEKHPTFLINTEKESMREFTARFPFSLTKAQEKAIADILTDFKKEAPMSRLLEGDVGSGKTAVGATAAYAVVTSRPRGQDFGNLQVAYMAPTEILAKQHFESFIECFSHLPVQIGLITGSGCKKFPSKVNPEKATEISRVQLLKWVQNGEIPILVGTHALIQKTVKFKHLACVIIDEQHRFGTMQRYALARKEERVPHLLSMTATPIPRTLALTIYGDLDLTLLDEMPPGRKQVITKIVAPDQRPSVYAKVREELETGHQAYVICPKIEFGLPGQGEGKLEVRNVQDEAARLKKEVFPNHTVEILHSKIKPKEKEQIMARFLSGEIHILVSTSVVEVGVNIPNATVIIIEGAERFGLAQLHQLRGRVLRSTHQAHCYLLSEHDHIFSNKRLQALEKAKNGFELAELDLALRGPGELSGKKQWGITDVGMEALKNIKMIEAARKEAQALIHKDPELAGSPLLLKKLQEKHKIHFE